MLNDQHLFTILITVCILPLPLPPHPAWCFLHLNTTQIQTYQQCPADVGAAQCGLLDNCHACHYGNVCQWKDASPSQECVIRPETHAGNVNNNTGMSESYEQVVMSGSYERVV